MLPAELALSRPDEAEPRPNELEPPHASGGEPLVLPSFNQLYELYFAFTWRVLGHLGVPDHALDDAVQEVWITVHRRLGSFEGRSALRTWLFGIALNVVRNLRRADDRRTRYLAASAATPETAPDAEALHAGQEAWALVQRFANTLDEQRRAIFVCNMLEHLSAAETAEATGVDVATVYKRVRSLRHALKQWLDTRDEGTGGSNT
jgi:RNA polymerase sigma-70 factor (ECF subfamily)